MYARQAFGNQPDFRCGSNHQQIGPDGDLQSAVELDHTIMGTTVAVQIVSVVAFLVLAQAPVAAWRRDGAVALTAVAIDRVAVVALLAKVHIAVTA